MATYLPIREAIKYLSCPFDKNQELKLEDDSLACGDCHRTFRVTDNIIEFVDSDNLDQRTRDELKGNTYSLDTDTIAKFASKDKWSRYHRYCSDKKLNQVIKRLDGLSFDGIVSLGSGTGFEIQKILHQRPIKLVFSSDLSLTATMIVPVSLKEFDVELCLFTSDFRYPPVKPNDRLPVIIYEAMHHTSDVHETFGRLLRQDFRDILFVEPTTNFIVRFLGRFGLAEREEYSGFKPSFLSIPRLRELCQNCNYDLEIHTVWEFPEDYFNKIFGDSVIAEKLFTMFMDVCSGLGDLLKFGSMSIGYLRKRA